MSRSLGGVWVTSRSPMKILPSLTSSRPASMRRVVDLPHPEGPTRTLNSPSLISRSMPGTAGTSDPGYQRWAFSNETVAMTVVLLSPAGTCRTILRKRVTPVTLATALSHRHPGVRAPGRERSGPPPLESAAQLEPRTCGVPTDSYGVDDSS